MSITIRRAIGDPNDTSGAAVTLTFQLTPDEIREAGEEYEIGRLTTKMQNAVNAWLDHNGFPHDLNADHAVRNVIPQMVKYFQEHRNADEPENETARSAAAFVLAPAIRNAAWNDYRTHTTTDGRMDRCAFERLTLAEFRELMWDVVWKEHYKVRRKYDP